MNIMRFSALMLASVTVTPLSWGQAPPVSTSTEKPSSKSSITKPRSTDRFHKNAQEAQALFTPAIELKNGTIISLKENSKNVKKIVGNKKILPGDPKKARRAERFNSLLGNTVSFTDKEDNLQISYRDITRSNINALYKGAQWTEEPLNYKKYELIVTAKKSPVDIKRVLFFNNAPVKDAKISGYTDGSVILGDGWYAGIEHPMAKVSIKDSEEKKHTIVEGFLPRNYVLEPNQKWNFSAVIGSAPKGQERRAFLNYLENERAFPYHLFIHYNSWYHLCISTNNNQDPLKRLTEKNTLKAMRDFSDALFKKRGVYISSYLWDDGWDNWDSLWEYHAGFPNKFKPLAEEAKRQKSGISAWLSPWGGYGHSKAKRVEYGKTQDLEIINGGYSLRAPKYFEAFKNRCLQMIKDYNMNMFKFDGMGAGTWASGAPEQIAPDLEGMLKLIMALRQEKPDVFINCTVGTWASPFWIIYADSIWRQGDDCDYKGVGNKREQWITYRDGTVYKRFPQNAPLFPLNSIMNHGVIVGEHSIPGPMPRGDSPEATTSFANEMWTMAGSGTNLQELYISPHLMTEKWWDITADAIKWARKNEISLIDTHWIGEAPESLKIYGYASWSPEKATIMLRNPSDTEETISGSLSKWLQLPDKSKSPRKVNIGYSSTNRKSLKFDSPSKEQTITMSPFEVIVLDIDFSKE